MKFKTFFGASVLAGLVAVLSTHIGNAGTITGFVWVDENANGIRETGTFDSPLTSSPLVHLFVKSGSSFVRQSTTGASPFSGSFNFTVSLANGAVYYLAFQLPSGYNFTQFRVSGGTATTDSDVNQTLGFVTDPFGTGLTFMRTPDTIWSGGSGGIQNSLSAGYLALAPVPEPIHAALPVFAVIAIGISAWRRLRIQAA